MAPSTVFSYLRGQHRRGSSTSNPPSPLPPSSQHSANSPLQVQDGFYPPRSPDDRSANFDQPASPRPYHSGWEAPYTWEKLDRGGAPKDSDSRSIASGGRRIPSSPLFQSRPASSAGDSPKPLSANGPWSSTSNQSLAPPHAQFFGFNREYGVFGQSRSTEKLPSYENVPRTGTTPPIKSPTSLSNQPQRTGMARLNLLNPMTLLARRRSSQTLAQQDQPPTPNLQNLKILALPSDYDPRIRGPGIHDFSAPRARRNYSSNDVSLPPFDTSGLRPWLQESGRRRSDAEAIYDYEPKHSEHTPHTPLFKEHFGDDSLTPETSSPRFSPFDLPPPDRDPPPLPPFAKNLPADVPSPTDAQRNEQSAHTGNNLGSQSLAVVPEVESQSTSQSSSPPRTSTLDTSFQPTMVPKRLASNASRFSFDLGGAGSAAQEKLLEEKHKQKEAERRAAKRDSRGNDSDDDFDYNDMDYDDGLEERIPGVNADLDDEVYDDDALEEPIPGVNVEDEFEESIPGVNVDFDNETTNEEETPDVNVESDIQDHVNPDDQQSEKNEKIEESTKPGELEGFRFTPAMASSVTSPTSTVETGRISQATPRDESGNVIGFAMSKESPEPGQGSSTHEAFPVASTMALQNGLGLVPLQINNSTSQILGEKPLNHQPLYEEDDLYFDDGNIEGPPVDAEQGVFDEAIFDDETSNLYDRPLRNPGNLRDRNISPDQTISDSDLEGDEYEEFSPTNVTNAIPQTFTKAGIPRGFWASTHHHPSISGGLASKPSGLTEDNLAAYHNALASAANEAAVNGRFTREESISQASETTSQMDEANPGLMSDDSRTSRGLDSLRPFSNDHLKNDFSYEDPDDLDDDAIIAAANADALENDDEGFYGQEFGFYAKSNGNCNGEMVNGGYFGPRGVEGITRSHSGRVNFREPSLTPITERSEWSTRNSVISLSTLGIPHSAHTLPSPGLAQLAGMDDFDDDMSLPALMKLRRGAFGGSNGSLRSSAAASQASGSPLTHLPPVSINGPNTAPLSAPSATTGMGHHVTGSTYSLASSTGLASANGIPEESDEEGSPASPTLTMDTASGAEFTFPHAHGHDALAASPMRKGAIRGRGHSRGSSGAESVSYVKETDADGSGRWILERRRTGESGELEVIGREILSGARI